MKINKYTNFGVYGGHGTSSTLTVHRAWYVEAGVDEFLLTYAWNRGGQLSFSAPVTRILAATTEPGIHLPTPAITGLPRGEG